MNDESILQASRYADGDMELEEQQQFESLLSADPELREYLSLYQMAQKALKRRLAPDETVSHLKQNLQLLGTEYFKPEHTEKIKPEAQIISLKPRRLWIQLSAIAAVFLIGLMIYAPWQKGLYQQYNTSNMMSVAERGNGQQTTLEKAADFYNKKEFTEAEKLLLISYTSDSQNSYAAYYYGITLIENNKEIQARKVLQELYKGESAFKYDAAYYIALSYLKQNDQINCKKWLKNIPAGTSNSTKARELEKKL